MIKATIIDCWLNNLERVLKGGCFNFDRQKKFNYFYRKYNLETVKKIDALPLWENNKKYNFESFKKILKELGF